MVLVLGSFQSRGILLLWHVRGQGPAVLALGAGCVGYFLCVFLRPYWDRPVSIRPSVNFFSLSHLLQDHWLDLFETCPSCSPSGLVVHVRKWFRSVDKYGCWRPTLIFTVIASPPKPLEEFCRNLAYEFLSVSRCVRPKRILVRQQAAIYKINIWPSLNSVTISLSHLRDTSWKPPHWLILGKMVSPPFLGCFWSDPFYTYK